MRAKRVSPTPRTVWAPLAEIRLERFVCDFRVGRHPWESLRAEQDAPANKALEEARAAFGKDKPDDGYAKYQEIVDRYYAAACYRNVKRWLAERK